MMLSEKQTARRARPIGLLLLAAFIVVPLAEIAVLIQVGGLIGVTPTLALIILTAVVGAWMLRRQGTTVLRRAQQQMQQGAVPIAEVFEGFCLVIAGALLLTPGFLTDAVGALLLLPPVRSLLYARVRRHLEQQVRAGTAPHPRAAGGAGPAEPPQGERVPQVIDADFEEIEPDDMPPPRGSWKRGR